MDNKMNLKNRCCNNFFKFFDYFGVNFTFKIKNERYYKTSFGGKIFLLFLIVSSLYFINLFVKFCKRTTFSINNSMLVKSPAPKINFKESKFNIAFSIQDDNTGNVVDLNFLKNLGFSLSINLTTINYTDPRKRIKTSKSIETNFCDVSNFPFNRQDKLNLNNKFFEMHKIANFSCIKEDEEVQIEGTFTDDIFTYVEISFLIHNLTNLSLQSQYLNKNVLKLNLYWPDTTIDVDNYQNPLSQFLRTHLSFLDFNRFQKVNIDLSILDFSTDDNIILANPQNSSFVSYKEEVRYDLIIPDRKKIEGNNAYVITKIYIRSSTTIFVIGRIYQKLSTFLANYAGLMSNCLLGLYIFVSFLNKFWSEQEVMNNILKFREHLQVSFPKELDLIKKNFKKSNIILESSIPLVNDEYKKNEEKISQKFNQNIIIGINEIQTKHNNGSKLQNNSIYLDKEPNLESDRKSFSNYIDVSEESKIPSQITSKEKLKNTSTPNNQLTIDFEKIGTANKRLSYHQEILKRRRNNVNSLDKTMEKIYSKKNKALNFNCFEILWKNCCWKSKSLTFKNILYQKATNKLEYYFDIFTHIRKMQEIDILKYLLLDKDQVNMFNFLSKPSISKLYSDSDEIYQNLQKNREFQDELKMDELIKIIKSYDLLKDKTDEVNEKLFYLFDYEVDNLTIG